jgi:hypothetical protein
VRIIFDLPKYFAFEVLTRMTMNSIIFWNVTACTRSLMFINIFEERIASTFRV